ncbi:MAG TPA: cytochrome c maturation protein CcmE, partial [Acidimicrobiales bacterium]|nr:cytochrome c maturation protein CcmE [Acidimicrobiales bacterium]
MALSPPPPPPSATADEVDEDLPPVDLTPRPPRARGRRRLPVIVALVAVAGALVFIAVQSLGSASMFFYNADEAVANRDELGESRFRLQGTVEEGSVQLADEGVEFVV